MKINGPLIISIQEDEASLNSELHIGFKSAFVQLNAQQRTQVLIDYMNQLSSALQPLAHDNLDRMGMETVYEICDNLKEHIRADEIYLDETIVVEIQPTISIARLISGNSSIN